MASVPKVIGSQQNFSKIPVLGLVPESASTAPTSPVAGQLWLDTSLTPARLKTFENGGWVLVSQTGTEQSANKGAASGYAGLDGSSRLAAGNLPLAITAAGLTGATAASRYVGATASGAPATGTFAVGDFTIDQSGNVWVCTAAGSPGTWLATFRLGTTATTALAGNTRLDQVTAPTASVSLNSQTITNLGTPVNGTDAVNKNYADSLSAGLDPKASVRAASTANLAGITYTATGGTSGRGQITTAPNTLDGVTLAAGNRLLLKDLTTGAQNGLWVVSTLGTGANGVWDRATDFDQDAEVTAGAFVFVEEGTANDNTGWVLGTNNPIVIGGASGTALTWVKFTGGTALSAGAGLTQTGSTFDVVGTAGRIIANADSIDIDSAYVGQTSIITLGTVGTGTWQGTAVAVGFGGTGAATAAAARTNLGVPGYSSGLLGALAAGVETLYSHGLNNQFVHAQFFDATTNYEIGFSWRQASTTQIGVTADVAYSANAVRAVVIG